MQKLLTTPPIVLTFLPHLPALRMLYATFAASRATWRQPAIAMQLPEIKLARILLIALLLQKIEAFPGISAL
jgi:hypothetical protein